MCGRLFEEESREGGVGIEAVLCYPLHGAGYCHSDFRSPNKLR